MALQSCFFLVFVALMMTVQLHSVLGNIQVPTGNNASTAVLPSSGPGYNTTVMLNLTASFRNTDSMTETPTQGPNKNTEDSTTAGLTVQSTSSRMPSEDLTIVRVATVVGSALGFLLLLAVLLYFYRRRYIAESQVLEDNTPAQLDKGIGQVGRRESRPVEQDDVENTYQTIQDSAVNSTELPAIPTASLSEYNQNYSTIPDLKSLPTVDRVDERAPAPPLNQTEQSMIDYYSFLYDYIAASVREDQAGTLDSAKTSQEPEYAAIAPTN